MSFSAVTYALSKKYTEETTIGLGAIKGAPCTINSISKTNGVTTIELGWTASDGTLKSQSFSISDGLSAYQIAVNNGFVGTEAEWLKSLVGQKGIQGDSAYQVAVAGGYTGTQEQWLISLKGDDGASAYQLAVAGGYTGTQAEWLESLKGDSGKSAYEIAVDGGYTGTEAEWLESLKGAEGKSAYDIAVENGFSGTEEEWLTSLNGESVTINDIIKIGGEAPAETDTQVMWVDELDNSEE